MYCLFTFLFVYFNAYTYVIVILLVSRTYGTFLSEETKTGCQVCRFI